MYGKFFSSTFTGSMLGAGADVFAVWGYVIANAIASTVELNPMLLAPVIGSTPEKMKEAIDYLCRPDPQSRTPKQFGRRLLHESAFQYHVVNHDLYRSMRTEEERRAYNRIKQRESRARQKAPKDETTTDAQLVMAELRLANPRLRGVIQAAIDSAAANGKMEPAEIGNLMVKGYRCYLDANAQGRLRFIWGPAKFFSEGHWASDRSWPIMQA